VCTLARPFEASGGIKSAPTAQAAAFTNHGIAAPHALKAREERGVATDPSHQTGPNPAANDLTALTEHAIPIALEHIFT
jgi:hypothetical protein